MYAAEISALRESMGIRFYPIIGIWKVTPIITYQVQFRLNQGAFSSLPEQQRNNVETAIERYVNRVMLPKVPAILVRNDMSLDDLRLEIAMRENQREEALRQIKGLEEVIAAAREAP